MRKGRQRSVAGYSKGQLEKLVELAAQVAFEKGFRKGYAAGEQAGKLVGSGLFLENVGVVLEGPMAETARRMVKDGSLHVIGLGRLAVPTKTSKSGGPINPPRVLNGISPKTSSSGTSASSPHSP